MLYIVSTPIGNMQDMTFRAVEILKTVDSIICEDTRQTGKLLNHYGIDKKMFVLNDFNEEIKSHEYVEAMRQGATLALVSDSGTPLISDPGFRLVREAIRIGIQVIPVPGPSAVVAALSVAGLPSDSFLFLGFLPKNKTNRVKKLEALKNAVSKEISPTIILYETPHAIQENLELIKNTLGDIELVVARELTKVHEEKIRGKISELLIHPSITSPKGEFVLLFRVA